MIRTFKDLSFAIMARIDVCVEVCGVGNYDAQRDWYNSDLRTLYLRELLAVYKEAEDNPPDGVVGVGIITYAEAKMQEAQSHDE